MINQSITIVTAFFDIGRGSLEKKDIPSYLLRTTETYFSYFSNLAKLNNPMVVFTSNEYIDKIKEIRKGKPTEIISFDIFKFKRTSQKIRDIQNSPEFIHKVNSDLRNNIEYWNDQYVLVTNLKSYFVYKAIKDGLIKTKFISWVDFGYVRDESTLNGISEWSYKFEDNKINFFSINKLKKLRNTSDVYRAIFNNSVYVIGGAVVGDISVWRKFFRAVLENQRMLLKNKVVDDDQGVFLMVLLKNKELCNVNYLGKDNWFYLFRRFDKTSKISIKERIKDFFI